ncbi:hypothetical protein BC830DRAFT_683720 [Chytriomyces sp. MP71]|nr:hypothetical protein BC830DRAFT_683720 [Chytriomyces sp. MP71]
MNRTTADRPTLLPTAGCAVFDSGRNPFLSPSAATDEGGTLARDYVRPANRPADAFATTSRHAPTRERHSSHLSENDCFACAASAASAQHHEDSQQVMSESQRYNWDTDFDSDDDDPATEPPVAPSPHANAFDFDDLSHEELASCDIAEQESIRRQAAQAKKEERERHEGIYLTQAGLSVRDTSRRVAGEDISAKESLADQILKCSEEQREFLRQVALGNNVFITGSAKTGKSFTVSLAIKTLRMAGHQVAIVAPTGMAAIRGPHD